MYVCVFVFVLFLFLFLFCFVFVCLFFKVKQLNDANCELNDFHLSLFKKLR